MKPYLDLKFDRPRVGFWDGGAKAGGEFTLEHYGEHPGPGHFLRWGCYSLNFWFIAKSGRSWGAAAQAARTCLIHLVKVPATVEIVWEDKV